MSSKLEHALMLAENGFYVFPCKENDKTPLVPWTERSTRNPKTITDWWMCSVLGFERNHNIGIDCGKSGILVIDVDVKPGKKGRETYEQFDKEFGWPETYTVQTPSGGAHHYYRGSFYRSTQGDKGGLGPGIDTRCEGGYVVAPGSTIDGKDYTVIRQKQMEDPQLWLTERLQPSKSDAQAKDSSKTIIADNEDDIKAAIEFLQNHPPSVEGDGGDLHTYVAFCHLKERGMSIQTAIDLMAEHWNPNCSPPWDMEELTAKANHAYKYAQNATGAHSPHAEFDIPKGDNGIKPENPKPPSRFNEGFLLPDAKSFPAREWVYGKLALAKNVTLIIAPPGVGKSTLTLDIGLSKAAGKEIFGIKTLGRGTVAIFNNEDNIEEQSRRLVAAGLHYDIKNEDISDAIDGSRLLLNGRDNAPLTIAKRDKHGKIVAHQAKELTEYLIKHKVKMLIVDPLAMTHPADENKNEEMLIVGNLYAEVANRANCAVILVHHTRKLNQASSQGHDGNLDSARGASSLGGVVRVAYTLNVMSKTDAKRYGIDEDRRTYYLLLEQAKANMSAPGEHRMFFERIGVEVGMDNESVGVLKPASLTALSPRADAITDLIKALEEVCPGNNLTRAKAAVAIVQLAEYNDKQPETIEKRINALLSSEELTGIKYLLKLEEGISNGRKVKIITTKLLANAAPLSIDGL